MIKKLLVVTLLLHFFSLTEAQDKIFVALNGLDNNPGTISKPLRSLQAAIKKTYALSGRNVSIEMRAGTYTLDNTIEITSAGFSVQSLTIQPYSKEKVIISGGRKLTLQWKPYKNGIVKAVLDMDGSPDQFFLNGKSLHMARYPNFDPAARVFNGTAADALSDERVKSWQNPAGGYIHALHQGEWGAFHYRITGKDANGKLIEEGGWQNNRPAPMHKQHRFVENIFEELDAPGEWFYDIPSKTLFVYPPEGINMSKSVCTVTTLSDLLHFRGSEKEPVKNISVKNIVFTQTARSFMEVKEPLLRSDWTIYRGGAILLEGTENIRISNCSFNELGGNAIFLSNFNKQDNIIDNHIYDIGANAIAFVGSAGAVRSPAFRYELFVPWNEMDYNPGPKTNEYPQYCTASGNLIHHIGTVEKQIAGVEIDMAAYITVSHNSIYDVPRSGINIGDGCWGGHILEYNDVFNTVLETGDHGAFNSWGRDRFWRPERPLMDSIVAAKPGIELLDVIAPIIIRNNRFQCDHGWDIDLDDGSSNYEIYNNICLNGGLKLREGYHRIVRNNILVNNTFHPHVWLKNSGDVFKQNIVTTPYAPILMNNWGAMIDSNFFLTKEGLLKAKTLGLDAGSAFGEAGFADPIKGDYHLKAGSPAFQTGFKEFDRSTGVTLPELKSIAARPAIKPLITKLNEIKGIEVDWLGAQFKNIETLGEKSAAGLHDNNGALLMQLSATSVAAKNNLQKGDVIIKMGEQDINSISDLLKIYQSIKWMGRSPVTIVRNQATVQLNLSFK